MFEQSEQSPNIQTRNRYRVRMILTLPDSAERRHMTKKMHKDEDHTDSQ
ncbi:hypothetical protein [Vibrio cidicii]|nr:hypothetical protein [Vibrio cidicii]